MKKYIASSIAVSLSLFSIISYAGPALSAKTATDADAPAGKKVHPLHEEAQKFCKNAQDVRMAHVQAKEYTFDNEECLSFGSPEYEKKRAYVATPEGKKECEALVAKQYDLGKAADEKLARGEKDIPAVPYDANCFNILPESSHGKIPQNVSEATAKRHQSLYN